MTQPTTESVDEQLEAVVAGATASERERLSKVLGLILEYGELMPPEVDKTALLVKPEREILRAALSDSIKGGTQGKSADHIRGILEAQKASLAAPAASDSWRPVSEVVPAARGGGDSDEAFARYVERLENAWKEIPDASR